MKEEDPIEHFADQVSKLLAIVQQSEKRPLADDLPPDIFEKVSRLENDVALFCELTAKNFEEQVISEIKEGEPLTARQRHTLDRIKRLRSDATLLQMQLTWVLSRLKGQDPKDSTINLPGVLEEEKKKGKASKDKLKAIGSKKNWMRM